MIELLPAPKPDVVAFRLRGDLDRSSFDNLAKEIDDRTPSEEKLRLYAEVEDVGDVSADILFDGLRKAIRERGRFRRVALVSSKPWLEKLAKVQDRLWFDADVNHFGFGEQDQAMQWLTAA